ncbi:MAG: 50S ribosomal protein L18Ae [Candidatus Marsarchaeota archaeon]
MSDVQPNVYLVVGRFSDGFYVHQFRKFTVAKNEKRALERVLSEIGSKHHVKRGDIRVESVKRVEDPNEIDDPLLKKMVQNERGEG